MMQIIADENIPCVTQAFAEMGRVTTLPGRQLTSSDVKDCDCLLVRSITAVNESLLSGSGVKFVATATIGTDHIDLDYLQQQNIGFANAPGCNAESAAEYVINVLFALAKLKGFDPFGLTAGIIGHGNVGSRVKQKLEALGIAVRVNDPPLQHAGDDRADYVSLQTLLHECDFITCHVPLTHEGDHPTCHLFDQHRLKQLKKNSLFFNAARGAVVDNAALSTLLSERHDLTVFLDTWEGEPAINQKLLTQVDFATPHIAGYSVEGKLRGTQMILDAANRYFNTTASWTMQNHLPARRALSLTNHDGIEFWSQLFEKHYSVKEDYQRLLDMTELPGDQFAIGFDRLRKKYPQRFEYSRFEIEGIKDKTLASRVERLGFS